MATAQALLDTAREYLHDETALIWTEAELLDYCNDGFRRLVGASGAIRALAVVTVPPRLAATTTHPWEAQYAPTPTDVWTWGGHWHGEIATGFLWEIEQAAGATPANSPGAVTQPWEKVYAEDSGRIDRYAYPADHDRTVRMTYDFARISPQSPLALDTDSSTWETNTGTPKFATGGLGSDGTFSVVANATGDGQAYSMVGVSGTPAFAGSRTYTIEQIHGPSVAYAFTDAGDTTTTNGLGGPGVKITTEAGAYEAAYAWEVQHIDGDTPTAVTTYTMTAEWEYLYVAGTARSVDGYGVPGTVIGERQYYPVVTPAGSPPLGTLVAAASAVDNLLVDYVVAAPTLAADDAVPLLPAACDKYLRAYILTRAYGREGEGKNPVLAAYHEQRWEMGVTLMKRLGQYAQAARTYQRDRPTPTSRTPLRPQLPSNYPRVR